MGTNALRPVAGLAALGVALTFACDDGSETETPDSGTNAQADGSTPQDAGTLIDTGVPDSGPPPPTADQYCEEIVDFFCDYYLRCGRIVASSMEECRSTFLETCNGLYERRYSSLANRGLLELSASGLTACETHLANVACEQQLRDLDGPCASVWTGTVPAGGACAFDVASFICAPGTRCAVGLDLCGECQPVVADGQSCESSSGCLAESECVSGLCVPRPKVGEPCTGEPRCVLGAACEGGTCRGPTIVGLGDSCDADRRCPYKSACIGGQCIETGLLGDPCGPNQPCASGWCNAGTCVAFSDEGSACDGNLSCASGSCESGTCAPYAGACLN